MYEKIQLGKIYYDLDREKIESIVETSIDFIMDRYPNAKFDRTKEDLMKELKNLTDSNRVYGQVFLSFRNSVINDLQIRVDLQKRKILAISERFPTKRKEINGVLRHF